MLDEDRPVLPSSAGTATRAPYLLIAPDFVETGGMDVANHALASHLARDGHAVHLVSFNVGRSLRDTAGVIVHRAAKPADAYVLGGPFLAATAALSARALMRDGARIVSNGGNVPLSCVNWVHYVHAAYEARNQVSAWRRAKQHVDHRLSVHTERLALKAARVVIANSNRTARDLVEHVGLSADRVRVVYYGIDPARFRPASPEEKNDALAELGWPADRPRGVFVGGLGDRRKGFDTLFTAWARLAKDPAWRSELVVVGRGAELAIWQQRAIDAGIGSSFRFLGFRDDVPRILRACDALVAPTRYEAYGQGVHEALCCGLPAIVSASAGVAERYPPALRDLLLNDPNDSGELVDRLREWDRTGARLQPAVQALAATLRARGWDAMSRDISEICEEAF